MKPKTLVLAAVLTAAAALALAAPAAAAQETFRFGGATLSDGSGTYENAQIQVRVKDSAGGGYTRADYFDAKGKRLGFYEAFEVVSRDEAALRDWAIANFRDRTGAPR
jgi:ABC-type sugar transport system substrate-binding protein